MTEEQINQAVDIVSSFLGTPKYLDHPHQRFWVWYGKARGRPTRADLNLSKDHRWPDKVGVWAWSNYSLEWQKEAYLLAHKLNVSGVPYKVYRGDGQILQYNENEFKYDHMNLTGVRGDEFDYYLHDD
jgi:hypothetical protein